MPKAGIPFENWENWENWENSQIKCRIERNLIMPRKPGTRVGVQHTLSPRNTSGVIGVHLDTSKPGCPCWVGAWIGADGKPKRVWRAVNKYGYQKAKELVIEARQAAEKELDALFLAHPVHVVRCKGSKTDCWQVRWREPVGGVPTPTSISFSVRAYGGEGAAELKAREVAQAIRKRLQAGQTARDNARPAPVHQHFQSCP